MVTHGEFINEAESEEAAAVSDPNKDTAGKTTPGDPPKLNTSSCFQEEGATMAKCEQLAGAGAVESQEVADAYPEDLPALLHQYSENASQQYKTKPADPPRASYLKTSLSTPHSKGVI